MQGKWSKEQDAKLRELVTERGPSWKDIGIILGRLPEGCRDRSDTMTTIQANFCMTPAWVTTKGGPYMRVLSRQGVLPVQYMHLSHSKVAVVLGLQWLTRSPYL